MPSLAALWERINERATQLGRGPWKLTESRKRLLRGRLSDGFTEDQLVGALDGYRAFHAKSYAKGGDFDPDRYLTPDTLYRPSQCAKYIEAGESGQRKVISATEERMKRQRIVEESRRLGNPW